MKLQLEFIYQPLMGPLGTGPQNPVKRRENQIDDTTNL